MPDVRWLELIKSAVASFPPLTAAGLSGFRAAYLKELWDGGVSDSVKQCERGLIAFVRAAAQGLLPDFVAAPLLAARLTPLKKKSGGVRPIASGEVLRRLVSKVLCTHFRAEFVQLLSPVQLGVGVPRAAEQITHRLQALLSQLPEVERFVLQVDVRNAFNSLSRCHILNAIQDRIPPLLQWAAFSLAPETPLYVQGKWISSSEGVQQGDPLGPAWFAIGLLEVTRMSQALEGVKGAWWFLDDGVLVGSVGALEKAMAALIAACGRLHLEINLAKCCLWNPTDVQIPPLTWGVPVIAASEEKVLLGCPWGPQEVINKRWERKIHELEELWDALPLLDDCQMGLVLLRACLGVCKIGYLLRCLPPSQTASLSKAVSFGMRGVLQTLLKCPVNDLQWKQAVLPVVYGGLGLHDSEATGVFAFLASIIAFYIDGTDHDVTSLARHPAFWEAVVLGSSILPVESMGKDFIPLKGWLLAGAVSDISTEQALLLTSQRWWMCLVFKHNLHQMMLSASIRDAFRLQCLQSKISGAFTWCIPSLVHNLAISDGEFRLVLKHRLGIPVLPVSLVGTPCPVCAQPIDMHGEHALTCLKSGFWRRHNVVRDLIFDELQAHGIRAAKEKVLFNNERPADLFIDPWVNGKAACVDVTITHATLDTTTGDLLDAQKHVVYAENEKKRKYAHYFPSDSKLEFLPVGFDTFGQPGPGAKHFLFGLKKLLRNAAVVDEDDIDIDTNLASVPFYVRLSVALARSIGQQLAAFCLKCSTQFDCDAPLPTSACSSFSRQHVLPTFSTRHSVGLWACPAPEGC